MSGFTLNNSCPTLDGASIHAILSTRRSPSTSKEMKVDPDFGTIVASVSESILGGEFARLSTFRDRRDDIGTEWPRCAVQWVREG